MAQVWKCLDCGGTTQDGKVAGDHERQHNDGKMWSELTPEERKTATHYMDDLGE